MTPADDRRPGDHRGLCARCTHARTVESSTGSAFTLCRLSASDQRFPRYPRLPVLTCAGFRADVAAGRTPS
jgi:hypothetical protein